MSVGCLNRTESFQAPRLNLGTSEDAHIWEAFLQEDRIREDMSEAISGDGREVEQELMLLVQEHSVDNWDGYGAKSVTLENFLAAVNFLRMLPTTIPRPELGVDPDGAVVFEWYRRPGRVFSVAVEKDNRLTYAGLFDSRRVSGTDYFDADLPQEIFQNIQRVIS